MSEISALMARLATAQNEAEQLKQQLREKEARIARLEDSLQSLHRRLHERFEFVLGDIGSDLQAAYEQSVALLKESQQQSLTHIQADAVERARDAIIDDLTSRQVTVEDFDQYIDLIKPSLPAANLREGR